MGDRGEAERDDRLAIAASFISWNQAVSPIYRGLHGLGPMRLISLPILTIKTQGPWGPLSTKLWLILHQKAFNLFTTLIEKFTKCHKFPVKGKLKHLPLLTVIKQRQAAGNPGSLYSDHTCSVSKQRWIDCSKKSSGIVEIDTCTGKQVEENRIILDSPWFLGELDT